MTAPQTRLWTVSFIINMVEKLRVNLYTIVILIVSTKNDNN